MKEYIVQASVPKDWVWDDGEVHPEGGLRCWGKFDSLEKAKDRIAQLKQEVEESGLPFEAKIYSREITDWKLEWPMVLRIDAHAQPDSACVNGKWDWDCAEKKQPPKMPFIVPDPKFPGDWRWQVDVDVASGKILNWPEGIEAKVYFKSSDDAAVVYDGQNLNAGQYVPRFLRPGESDEDYLAVTITRDGRFKNWNPGTVSKWIASRQAAAKK